MINRLTVVGVGLIGGSLARALREAGAVGEVVGCSRDAAHLARAQALGVVDRYTTDVAEAVQGADVVLLAIPVGAMPAVLAAMAPVLAAETVLTDAGSTKVSVLHAVTAAFGSVPANFVAGHPIAGTERSGVEASFAGLYRDRRVILTPTDATAAAAVDTVRRMWGAAGAVVELMTPPHHDEVFAATSHLPHVLAFSLVDTLATLDEKAEVFKYAAGGFRDFTRIASSDPTMWRDICLHNNGAIVGVLDRFTADLQALRAAIARGDGDYLSNVFQRAKQARDRFCDRVERPAPTNPNESA
jgi:prephenate dehydrogenase